MAEGGGIGSLFDFLKPWTCDCGTKNSGVRRTCMKCESPRPDVKKVDVQVKTALEIYSS
jgi:hypothetical protein